MTFYTDNKYKITVRAVYLCVSILLLLVILYIAMFQKRLKKLIISTKLVFNNDVFCEPQSGLCLLTWKNDLVYPIDITGNFNYVVARYCIDLISRIVLLSYHKHKTDDLQIPPGLILKKLLYYNNSIIGTIHYAESNRVVWITFRGTSNTYEWRQNFNFKQANYYNINEKQAMFTCGNKNHSLCHKGFLDIYSNFRKDIINTLVEISIDKIIINGHSLGGALATLCTMELMDKYTCYTYIFGGPRVCRYAHIHSPFFRIQNTTDIVTSIPLSVMPNLKIHNEPISYTHTGTCVEFTINRHSLVNNHLLPVYLYAIDNQILKISEPVM